MHIENLLDRREKMRIEEVASVKSSKRIFASEYVVEGIPFFRGKEITLKSKGSNVNPLFISEQRYKEISDRFGVPEADDIFVTSVGTIGSIFQAKIQDLPFYYKDGNVTQITDFDTDRIYPQFLKYYLESALGQNSINEKVIGSTQQALTINALGSVELMETSVNVQKKIVSILEPIDKKITLNKAINDNLLELATTMFSSDFPDITNAETTIGYYINPKRGKGLLSKDAIPGSIPVIAGGLSPATYHNVANTKAPVVTISASGANAGFVNIWTEPVWSSDSSFIDERISESVYFWYVMLRKRQSEIFDLQTGSAQPHIYPSHIESMPMKVVDIAKQLSFSKKVSPLFKKYAENIIEIEYLTKIRDTLLPKLLNGSIELGD
ncbi:MAG: restriction endonuclease subunit S [Lactobacillaceae bacterium]|nr:restriction endonuclease subunit S [Lactobacillaceae bacterium]